MSLLLFFEILCLVFVVVVVAANILDMVIKRRAERWPKPQPKPEDKPRSSRRYRYLASDPVVSPDLWRKHTLQQTDPVASDNTSRSAFDDTLAGIAVGEMLSSCESSNSAPDPFTGFDGGSSGGAGASDSWGPSDSGSTDSGCVDTSGGDLQ